MTFRVFSMLAGAAVLAVVTGCAPDSLPPTEGSLSSATPTTGGPSGHVLKANDDAKLRQLRVRDLDGSPQLYHCDAGQILYARYPDADHVRINYKQQDRDLKAAHSSSGARYVGQNYEWWLNSVGAIDHATLYEHKSNGTTGMRVLSCRRAHSDD